MVNWLSVYEHEISRRRRIAQENKPLFERLHKVNAKGLLLEKNCTSHVWVPATHLMIHDGAKKLIELAGINRRAFREASPYKSDGSIYVPQMCWHCDATRTKEIIKESTEDRLKKLKALRPRKMKGRKTQPDMITFDELFQD